MAGFGYTSGFRFAQGKKPEHADCAEGCRPFRVSPPTPLSVEVQTDNSKYKGNKSRGMRLYEIEL